MSRKQPKGHPRDADIHSQIRKEYADQIQECLARIDVLERALRECKAKIRVLEGGQTPHEEAAKHNVPEATSTIMRDPWCRHLIGLE